MTSPANNRLTAAEELNFLLTNRIPRIALSRLMGGISKIRSPLISRASIALWHAFCDVDLTDAAQTEFHSLHDGFTRRLKPGARSVESDPAIVTSPCDAIVGAFGRVDDGMALQVKSMPYRLADLLGSDADARAFEGGWFVTLRLTAGMYHRFHAPCDLTVEKVRYLSGDCWNVNPPALKKIAGLYCRNERAPIAARLDDGARIMLVPVAAVLVSSIRLPFLDDTGDVRSGGEGLRPVHAQFAKGEEMGWFEHGSTIVMLAPAHCPPVLTLKTGDHIRMGQPLLHRSISAD